MVWFTAILLILFYILIDICNFWNSKKISKITFFFSGLALMQIILGILTLSKISVEVYTPIAIFIVCSLLSLGILFMAFISLQKRTNTNIIAMNNTNYDYAFYFKNKGLEWFFIIGLFITSLFFRINHHDTTFYIALGNNFINGGVYTPTGIDSQITNNIYLIPTSFYLYPLLFGNNLFMSYSLINRLFYILFIYFAISFIIENIKFSNKKNYFFINTTLLLIGIIIFISNELFITSSAGGNISQQSINLFLMFIVAFYSKKVNLVCYIIPLGSLFFSATSLLIGTLAMFAINIYWFLCYKNKNKIIQYFGFQCFLILLSLLVFFGEEITALFNQTTLLLIYFFTIVFGFGVYFFTNALVAKGFFKKKELYCDGKMKLYTILTLLLILPIFSIIFWWIIPIIMDANILNFFHPEIMIVPMIMAILLFVTTFFSFKKNNRIDKLTIIIISFWIIGVAIKIVLLYPPLQEFNNNLSLWRVSWLVIGSGQLVNDLLFFIVIEIEISKIFKSYKKLNFLRINYQKWRLKYPLLLFSFSIIFTPIIYISHPLFTNNVKLNLSQIDKNDINFIENLDNKNFGLSFVTFVPIAGYINRGVNLTNIFDNENWIALSSNENTLIDLYAPNKFENQLRHTINLIKNGVFQSITNKTISQIDHIFLGANLDIEYSNIVQNLGYNSVFKGLRISVFQNKNLQ